MTQGSTISISLRDCDCHSRFTARYEWNEGDEHPISKVGWWRKDGRLRQVIQDHSIYGFEIRTLYYARLPECYIFTTLPAGTSKFFSYESDAQHC